MWPLQENNLTLGHPLETTGTLAKLTPVENTNDGYNDITACTQQQKQHTVLSVRSQKQTVSDTLTHNHKYTQTNEETNKWTRICS